MRREGGRGGSGVRRGPHPRFVGEHAALEAAGNRLADAVADGTCRRFLQAKGAANNHVDDLGHFPDMPQRDQQAGDDPHQSHQRHQPLAKPRHAFHAAHHDQQGEEGHHDAGEVEGNVECIVQCVCHGVGLHGIEDEPVGEQQEQGEEHAHPAHAQSARHIPGGPAAELPVSVTFFVELCQRAFGKAARHADNRRNPHPEHRAGAADGNRQRHACQVTAADARGQADAQHLE